jgi:hypothetical protein
MRRLYLPAGSRVARYELVRPIGSGGNGVVYEAIDASLGRRVAVKVCPMPGNGVLARRDQERFFREARAAAQVRHPNVVTVFDFGVEGDLAFLVMELVEGETLADLLRRERRLEVSRALDILLPILSAVAELHAHGVVHRDIKPANILLERGDSPCAKLVDFGISRFIDEPSTLTESGMTVGTPEYMAPEATRGSQVATERSDQYALGVVLYECATGTKPFRGATSYDVMDAVVRGELVPPSVLEPSLPDAFDRIVLHAMHREPHERFGSVDDLAGALLPFAVGTTLARWNRLATTPGPGRSAPAKDRGSATAACTLLVHDGIAVALRGDVFIALWKAPASMARIKWQFDVVDRFASERPGGVVALIIVLPSSSPPDGATAIEIMKRIRRVGTATRRQATVAVGGGVWQEVVKGVHRAMGRRMGPRLGRLTISGTLEGGIARLLEMKSSLTPTFAELRGEVLALHEALDVVQPDIVADLAS